MSAATVAERLRQRLGALSPSRLELADDSALHVGHPGAAAGGGHFRIMIVSESFRGRNRVERHRLVYAAVGDLVPGQVHALAIDARAPDEPCA